MKKKPMLIHVNQLSTLYFQRKRGNKIKLTITKVNEWIYIKKELTYINRNIYITREVASPSGCILFFIHVAILKINTHFVLVEKKNSFIEKL